MLKSAVVSWSTFFKTDFYHMSLLPLFLVTVVLAWIARPSTKEEFPVGFKRFQCSYLSIWAICVAADWLQGPYVYALYAAYGYSSSEIAQLFVAGFASSMVFGCFVGSITDRFGRKNCCLMYCVLYIVSCMTKHFKSYSILMLGRVTGGIATSMLFSCFECWMVSEHMQRNKFSANLLGYMFGLMFTVMYVVAIASGIIGQYVADAVSFGPISPGSSIYMGGFLGPFDVAIALLMIGTGLIAGLWEENYGGASGEESGSVTGNLLNAAMLLKTDKRIALLCVIVAAFEGSMFAFVFNWTPALESKTVPPPHGIIFAMFMMACMCGASTSSIVSGIAKAPVRLMIAMAAGVSAFVCASLVANTGDSYLKVSFLAFLTFEFCVGLYFPSAGVLKSDIVPEKIRGTMYNIYRIPLNAIVVALLLSNITMAWCFKVCAGLLVIAFVSVMVISSSSTKAATLPNGEADESSKVV